MSLRPLLALSPGQPPTFDGRGQFASQLGQSILESLNSMARSYENQGKTIGWQEHWDVLKIEHWWSTRPHHLRDSDDLDSLRALALLGPEADREEHISTTVHRLLVGQTIRPQYPWFAVLKRLAISNATSRTIDECLNGVEAYAKEILIHYPERRGRPRFGPDYRRHPLNASPWFDVLINLVWSRRDLFSSIQVNRWFQLSKWALSLDASVHRTTDLEVTAFLKGLATDDDLRDLLRNPEHHGPVARRIRGSASDESVAPEMVERAHRLLSETVTDVLAIERRRSDPPTSVSKLVLQLSHGDISLVMELLATHGAKVLSAKWGYSATTDKRDIFAAMVRHADASLTSIVEFEAAVRLHKPKDEALIALVLAAPQWIPHLQSTLGWQGLEDAVWFVHAHVAFDSSNFVQQRTALSKLDRESGLVDVAWFEQVLHDMGTTRWKHFEKWAKFASHDQRCTGFTQAIRVLTGSLNEEALTTEIRSKRSQHAVKNLGLLPLATNQLTRQSQLLERYNALLAFQSGSHAFGSMKRASEAKAVRSSLSNLAQRAGYDDTTRLMWMIESIQPQGTPSKDQVRQVRRSLEEAMVTGARVPLDELDQLLSHQVLGPEIRSVVWIDDAQVTVQRFDTDWQTADGAIANPDGRVRIAHPVELLRLGVWPQWQGVIARQEQGQAFRQVFREVYVPTDLEVGATESTRYRGNLVKAAQCFALLNSAGWEILGPEDGCTRTFHRHAIRAEIAPDSDYYSPKSAQPFSIESVYFQLIADGSRLSIESVPPIVFSETMRDLDLVVTVATAGRTPVQPSSSMIELRRTVVEHFIRNRNLENVHVSHDVVRIRGMINEYTVDLGTACARGGGIEIGIFPVHLFSDEVHLPFAEDAQTAEILSKVLLLAADDQIRDPSIAAKIRNL